MNSKIIGFIVLAVLLVGGFLLLKDRSNGTVPTENDTTNDTSSIFESPEDSVITPETSREDSGAVSTLKEVTIDSSSFAFSPTNIIVNRGDIVKITLRNVDGVHDLVIDEFNVSTEVLNNEGDEDTVTFVADKSGIFQYYCSIGNHRAMGMVGTLEII